MRAGPLFLAAAAAVGLALPAQAQTRLEQIYDHMHGEPKFSAPEPHKPQTPSSASPYSIINAFQGPEAGRAIVGLAAGAVIVGTTPFWVPAALFDQENKLFPKYPYARSGAGLVMPTDCDPLDNVAEYWDNALITKGWALRVSTDVGGNFDDLRRAGGQIFLDTNFYRLGVLANVNYYRESGTGGDPSALTSDVNLTYRLTQCEWLQMHFGLGARTWSSLGDFSGGVNAFYRGDVYPIRPVNVSTVSEIGNLDQTLYMHVRAQVGAHWRHGEVFLGYDWTRLAGVTLQGPLVGLRVWF